MKGLLFLFYLLRELSSEFVLDNNSSDGWMEKADEFLKIHEVISLYSDLQ